MIMVTFNEKRKKARDLVKSGVKPEDLPPELAKVLNTAKNADKVRNKERGGAREHSCSIERALE